MKIEQKKVVAEKVAAAIILVLLFAVVVIWALNVLLGLGIPFTWETVAAMWVLVLVFSGIRGGTVSE